MKNRWIGCLVLVFGILLIGMIGCKSGINPDDYKNEILDKINSGDYEAAVSNYKSLEGITDFKEQVAVGDNFITVYTGEIIGTSQIANHTFKKRETEINYIDLNKDLQVDEYHVLMGTHLTYFYSKQTWEKRIAGYSQPPPRTRYADEELQKIVDADYKKLREKGRRIKAHLFWYEQTFTFKEKGGIDEKNN